MSLQDWVPVENTVSTRIAGGFFVETPFKYPFAVSLWYQGKSACSGTLIAPNKVVTAAHCTKGYNIRDWRVKVHRQNLTKSDQEERGMTFQVYSRVYHPSFNPDSNENDVAVWTIWGKINAPYYATLDDGTFSNRVGTVLTAVGWGSKVFKGPMESQLQQVDLPIMDHATCQSNYKSYSMTIDSSTQFCAGYAEGVRDACSGDSGGPLFVTTDRGWVLVGLTSYGVDCGLPNLGGVYTKIAGVKIWIEYYLSRNY